MPAESSPRRLPQAGIWGLLAVALALFCLGMYRFYDWQAEVIYQANYRDLHSIAELKTGQILAWRQERLADARMNSSGMIRTLALEWQRTGEVAIVQDIRKRLQFFQENEGYFNMVLADPGGTIHLSLLPRITQLEHEEQKLLNQVIATGSALCGDFFLCGTCNQIHLPVATPIFDEQGKVAFVLLLISDPEQNLYPLINSWPVPHANAETLLVRQEDQIVRGLNTLRHENHVALQYTLPLSHTGKPAVQAALGKTGRMTGTDYREVEVLADLRQIPGTGWFMVAKADTRAMKTEALMRSAVVLALVLTSTLMTGAIVRLNSLTRQRALAQTLLRSEQEKQQARDEIRATLYGIADGVIATDNQGSITRMNPAAEQLTGWRETEALGKPIKEIYRILRESTGQEAELLVDKVLRNGASATLSNNLLLLNRDGQHKPIADSGAPIRDASGRITGVVLVCRDQSAQRAQAKALAESAKRYSDLVEEINDFIWEIDTSLHYTYASRRAGPLLGYQPEELIGTPWTQLLVPQPPANDANPFFADTRAQHLNHEYRKQDGSVIALESSITPVLNPQGQLRGYRGISRDISERKRAAEEQARLQAELLQSQKLETMGRLAGGIAHDFNNMLTVICSYVEILLNEIDEQHPFYRRLADVHHAAQHSAELTRQLLMFARRQLVVPAVIDVNQALTDSLRMLQRLIGEDIELIWTPGAGIWPVKMDVTQMGQVLANLAVNARDAIDGHGRIEIDTANVSIPPGQEQTSLENANSGWVRITFRDSGCGMDEATLAQIFEPFFTTKDGSKGTGLGLSSVYGIIKQNHGSIEASSQPGNGTTFIIHLPRSMQAAGALSSKQQTQEHAFNETILLVDDEAAILEIGTFILTQQGYTVLTAASPAKALVLSQEHPGSIDLLITDIIMPEMNGRELAARITAARPRLKILYISGYTADIIAPDGELEAGMQFLEKPFSMKSLRQKVHEVLHQG